MRERLKSRNFCGASALAIGAAIAFAPAPASACTGSLEGEGPDRVTVTCTADPEDPPSSLFSTSITSSGEPIFYDGSGDDRIEVSGGTVGVGVETQPPFVPLGEGGATLDSNEGAIATLGGNDFFSMSSGTVAGDVFLGSGDDRYEMSGGQLSGSVFGELGNDRFVISGGRIDGSVFGGDGNDTVTISGTADIGIMDGEGIVDSVGLEGGDDVFNMTGGRLEAGVSGGLGNDIITLSGGTVGDFIAGNQGNDQINMLGGSIANDLLGEDGDDVLTASGGTIGGHIAGGLGNDRISVSGNVAAGGLFGGDGADDIAISGGTIAAVVFGDGGDDRITVSGSASIGGISGGDGGDTIAINGGNLVSSVFGDVGDDVLTVSGGRIVGDVNGGLGNDQITVLGGVVTGNLVGEDGNDKLAIGGGSVEGYLDGGAGIDEIAITGGSLSGAIFAGSGNDIVTISAGASVGQSELIFGPISVSLDSGDDVFNMTGGTLASHLMGGAGVDRITVSGGAIHGDIEGESVTLTGGTIDGDIFGLSADTLTINDAAAPEALTLRDGVLFSGDGFSGTGANGIITDSNLAAGGKSQNFSGFDSLSLTRSTLRFDGDQDINQLNLNNGSTLFVENAVNMTGNLTAGPGSTISLINGVAGDVFTLGGVSLNAATIGLDINSNTLQADQLVADTLSATGLNTVQINLLGTPNFVGSTDIPILLAGGALSPANFQVTGIPGSVSSLFDFILAPGGGGGLVLRAAPRAPGLLLAPANAANKGIVDVAIDALSAVNRDAIDADLGLGASAVQIAPTFGVFASGQLAKVEHDGFNVSTAGVSGAGPSFDATDSSMAISLDFNAAKHYEFDDQYGLNIGLFAGYASTDVGLGAFQGFDHVGDGDNKSAMFGGYALFRTGLNYALVSASGYIGGTDVTNGVAGSTGSYDTQGYAVTASAGHIYALSDRTRLDLRGGILGVSFTGDGYTDSAGVEYGKSRISFGAIKFEPGIYADLPMENGMVFSPYLRGELQQRFSYSNSAILQGQEFEFDDADFSASAFTGFNLKMNAKTTLNGEVRGKLSADSSTVAAKLGLKVAF